MTDAEIIQELRNIYPKKSARLPKDEDFLAHLDSLASASSIQRPDTTAPVEATTPPGHGGSSIVSDITDPLVRPIVSTKRLVTGQTAREKTWGRDIFDTTLGVAQVAVPLLRGASVAAEAVPFAQAAMRAGAEGAAINAVGEGLTALDEQQNPDVSQRPTLGQTARRMGGAAVLGAGLGAGTAGVVRVMGGRGPRGPRSVAGEVESATSRLRPGQRQVVTDTNAPKPLTVTQGPRVVQRGEMYPSPKRQPVAKAWSEAPGRDVPQPPQMSPEAVAAEEAARAARHRAWVQSEAERAQAPLRRARQQRRVETMRTAGTNLKANAEAERWNAVSPTSEQPAADTYLSQLEAQQRFTAPDPLSEHAYAVAVNEVRQRQQGAERAAQQSPQELGWGKPGVVARRLAYGEDAPATGYPGPGSFVPPSEGTVPPLSPGDRVTYTHHGYEGGAESSSPAVVTSVGPTTVKIAVKTAKGESVTRTVKKETITPPPPPEASALPPASSVTEPASDLPQEGGSMFKKPLSPKFDQPAGGTHHSILSSTVRKFGIGDMEVGQGRFFDGKWQEYPYVSVKPPEGSGQNWNTARFSSSAEAERFASHLDDLHRNRTPPPPPEASAAPLSAPQEGGAAGVAAPYRVLEYAPGSKTPYRVVDTATGKMVKNEAGPAPRRFASEADAQAHADQLSAAKNDALRDMGKGGLRSGLDPREVATAMKEVGQDIARSPLVRGVAGNAHDNLRVLRGVQGEDIGAQTSDILHDMQLTRGQTAGRLRAPLVAAGLEHPRHFVRGSLDAEALREGRITLDQVPVGMRREVEAMAGVYGEAGRQRSTAGLKMLEDFSRHQHILDTLRKSPKERDLMAQAEVARGHFDTPEEAHAMMQSAFDLIDGKEGGEPFLQWVQQRNPDMSREQVLAEIRRQWREPSGTQPEGQRKQRVLDLPFYDWHQGRVLPRYIDAQAKLLTEVEHLGAPMGETGNALTAMRERLPQPALVSFDQNVRDVWGAHPSPWPEETSKAVNLGSDLASLVLSPSATVGNLGQAVVGTLARTRNPLKTAEIFARSAIPGLNRKAQLRAIRDGALDPPFQIETGPERGLGGMGTRKDLMRLYHSPLRWSERVGDTMGNEAGYYLAERSSPATLERAGIDPQAVAERGGLLPDERSRLALQTRYDVMGRNLPGETPAWMRSPLLKMNPATKFLTYPYLQARQNADLFAGVAQREGPMAALTGTGLLLGGNYLGGMARLAFENQAAKTLGGGPGDADYSPLRVMRKSPVNAIGFDQLLDAAQGMAGGTTPLQSGFAYLKELPYQPSPAATWETLTPAQKASLMLTGTGAWLYRMSHARPQGSPAPPRRPKHPTAPGP